jgi:hypothetical protein
VFLLHFRANITGRLDGQEILVTSKEQGAGRRTSWSFEGMPVEIISAYIDKPPVNWFESGSLTINVDDAWEYQENADINMDWRVTMSDVVIKAPDEASFLTRKVSAPVVKYINEKEGNLDLHFSLVMNEDEFDSTSSLDAAGLWDTVLESFSHTIAQKLGSSGDAVKEKVTEGMESFKNYLQEKRQPAEAPE